MCLLYLIGTIFPQGSNIEDYIKAGGKYVPLVRALGFLNISFSPLFLIATGVLIINLAVCLYDRLKLFLRIKRRPMEFDRLKNHPGAVIITQVNAEEKLKNYGFSLKAVNEGVENRKVKLYEKGLPYWWLSWFYHVGIIIAIFGFFLTALFAFEKEIVLYPDEPVTISLYSKDTRWNVLLKKIGIINIEPHKNDEYTLMLKDFTTEYYQVLNIEYPEKPLERLYLGLGLKKIKPSEKGFSYMPKKWHTRLELTRPDGRIIDADIFVNKPFRTGTLTLYQMGYEQKVTLSVNGEDREIEARVPFQVKGVKGRFAIGSLKLGTLYKKDGKVETIIPAAKLYYFTEKGHSRPEMIGRLLLGKSLQAKGINFLFKDYREGSYLSYRKDPGVWVVGIASLFVFVGLCVRSLGAWYRVQVGVEHNTSYVVISTRGILADRDRVIKMLKNKPLPIVKTKNRPV
jgi:cytochrome c biogenesis protein ResB